MRHEFMRRCRSTPAVLAMDLEETTMAKGFGTRLGVLAAAVALSLGCSDGNESADETAASASRSEAAQTAESKSGSSDGSDRESGSGIAGNDAPKADSKPQRTQEELVAAGRSVYNANCTACHSMNPAQDGALGPAVAGASYELLEARIVRGNYPEGYEPKRPSRIMVALPHLEPKLEELTAYLASL
jgi:mono/diheme cytochrome c family protein